ncbi:hypothetical protein M404DRAFT_21111 [Pisolithus tinctorius Marx 270]|uniref:Uncharacterized protein n=1 Tax=Pisolithus tinctorius Marx 270 TaxID=870435 RepID=A0A0C3KMU3_PISTI|nr:hypothetical protein M404DRAFT_21111 [Pisolithus tinctorius Marx 270]
MSNSRPIIAANNNNKGQVMVNWAQVPDDDIRYDTNNKEEVMRVKVKERKRRKAAEQTRQEEQVQLEAKRVERERVKAEQAEREAEEKRACKDEERRKAKEEKEAKAGKGSEARGEVKKVVMDPSCTRCAQAQVICKFLMDSNKKQVACVQCNQSKGKCCWPGDGKDTESIPKAGGVAKGKNKQKWVKMSARLTEVLDLNEPKVSGSRAREAMEEGFLGLEEKLEQLIDIAGLIANNLVGLFELQEATVENLGCIANMLKSIINKSYGFGVAVTPLDSGSSELDSDELQEEAAWLQAKAKGEEEEEAEGEDEPMAKAK